ncbi:aconitase family protein [Streptomyces sp. NPDC020845]|uniref:aconitase family protein n=1 Tax=Streptomyces sp. NPDC020845 TaxID=3365096 RepID=UPI00379F8C48
MSETGEKLFRRNPDSGGLDHVVIEDDSNSFGADVEVWDPDRIALFDDHLVLTKGTESRRLVAGIALVASGQGVEHHCPYGQSYRICDVFMCEEGLVRPGTVVPNVNSHSEICGAFTVFGSGVRVIDMVGIICAGDHWLRVLETIGMNIQGTLAPNMLAKASDPG